MKTSEIQMQDLYWTRIGNDRIQVRIVRECYSYNGKKLYEVARVDNGKILPKDRSAASLHKD